MVTIFTPTYNRAYILPQLYKSLVAQTVKDFEWLIIDDGSSDNTKGLIAEFQKERKIRINYVFKENGGKHTAINLGVELALGDLFFIVDSDDCLIAEAIELIYSKYLEIKDNENCAGIGFMRGDFQGHKIGTKFDFSTKLCNAFDLTYTYHVKGDMAELYKTKVLKNYPFPVYKNERFCPEALVWYRIAEKYEMLWVNKCIYLCEYLNDGLTNQITLMRMNSPKASTLYYLEQTLRPIPIKEKLKSAINFWRFSFSGHLFFNNICKLSLVYLTIIPLGFFMYLKDKYNVRKRK